MISIEPAPMLEDKEKWFVMIFLLSCGIFTYELSPRGADLLQKIRKLKYWKIFFPFEAIVLTYIILYACSLVMLISQRVYGHFHNCLSLGKITYRNMAARLLLFYNICLTLQYTLGISFLRINIENNLACFNFLPTAWI